MIDDVSLFNHLKFLTIHTLTRLMIVIVNVVMFLLSFIIECKKITSKSIIFLNSLITICIVHIVVSISFALHCTYRI